MNSRTKTVEKLYGATGPSILAYPKFVAHWRDTFFEGKIKIPYGHRFFNEAHRADMNYIALGNRFKARIFLFYYDFQYSCEGLDRRKVISNIVLH